MVKGILYALAACFIWGLIFVVPQYMAGFTSIEIALGRYFTYGVLSCLIFLKARLQGNCQYPKQIWLKTIYYSLPSTVGYYTFLILSLRYASPAITALILGISPITIAFYGNWKQKETTFKSLIIPSILILIGLVIINVPHLETAASPRTYFLGLACSLVSLVGWSWYVVANAKLLKDYPYLESSDWSTLLGVGTLFWVLFLGIIFSFVSPDIFQFQKYVTWSSELVSFLIGCAILGILCSWVGAYLWNKASLHIPVSLAGQLTICETIFGVIFIYSLQRQMPPLLETIGILILLSAIIYGIRQFSKKKTYNKELTPH